MHNSALKGDSWAYYTADTAKLMSADQVYISSTNLTHINTRIHLLQNRADNIYCRNHQSMSVNLFIR